MFDFVRGVLAVAKANQIVVENHGIGYRISVPVSLLARLPALGEGITLYLSVVVRETAQQLYGFLAADERDLFEVLINLSGIGPKTGLAIISHLSLQQLHQAVQQESTTILAKVPGIGKKTAERLLLDLRDKLPTVISCPSIEGKMLNTAHGKVQDAMGALINLGYNQSVAQQAVKKALNILPEEVELPILITTALREI